MEVFLDYVVKGLVDNPDDVQLTTTDRNGVTVYELRVNPADMGKIIGRQGATINAIRALLLVGSAKKGLRCSLEVIDEEGGQAGGGESRAERPPRSYDSGRDRSPRGRGPRGGSRGGRGGGRGPRRDYGGGGRDYPPRERSSEGAPEREEY